MPRPHAALAAAFLAFAPLAPAQAGGAISVTDAYLRALGPGPGAAFFTLTNDGDTDDRLVSVTASPGGEATIHATRTDAQGMSMMEPVEGGIPLPAHSSHAFASGGDHVMIMGLPRLDPGAAVTLTLSFEHADPLTFDAPLDNARKAGDAPAMHDMSGMKTPGN